METELGIGSPRRPVWLVDWAVPMHPIFTHMLQEMGVPEDYLYLRCVTDVLSVDPAAVADFWKLVRQYRPRALICLGVAVYNQLMGQAEESVESLRRVRLGVDGFHGLNVFLTYGIVDLVLTVKPDMTLVERTKRDFMAIFSVLEGYFHSVKVIHLPEQSCLEDPHA